MNKLWLPLLFGLFLFASCSEDEETVVEFPNWQATNEQAFQEVMDYAKAETSSGNTDQWKVSWTGPWRIKAPTWVAS